MQMDLHIVMLIVGILFGNSVSVSSKYFFKAATSRTIPDLTIAKGLQPDSTNQIEPTNQPDRLDKVDHFAHFADDTSVADTLARKVRVLCWVMTEPGDHQLKAVHVKETWGWRCNQLLFMSSVEDPLLPSVKLPVKENKRRLWNKIKEAYRYIYQHHLFDADWFVQADDATYVVVENLRHMLADYNTTDPIYFGSSVRSPAKHINKAIVSGSAGFVLSREAVVRFVLKVLNGRNNCPLNSPVLDVKHMDQCLYNIGVKPVDSRDAFRRGRLFPLSLPDHLSSKTGTDTDWYWTNIYRIKTGRDCCSEYAVCFHFVDPDQMYVLEYFVYHLRPFGISYNYN